MGRYIVQEVNKKDIKRLILDRKGPRKTSGLLERNALIDKKGVACGDAIFCKDNITSRTAKK